MSSAVLQQVLLALTMRSLLAPQRASLLTPRTFPDPADGSSVTELFDGGFTTKFAVKGMHIDDWQERPLLLQRAVLDSTRNSVADTAAHLGITEQEASLCRCWWNMVQAAGVICELAESAERRGGSSEFWGYLGQALYYVFVTKESLTVVLGTFSAKDEWDWRNNLGQARKLLVEQYWRVMAPWQQSLLRSLPRW